MRSIQMLAIGLLLLAVAACGPTATPSPEPTAEVLPEAILKAETQMAEALNVPVEQIEIRDVEQMEWPDACLGLAEPDEACAQVVTPGWRAVFEIGDEIYEVRTDEAGGVVRWQNS